MVNCNRARLAQEFVLGRAVVQLVQEPVPPPESVPPPSSRVASPRRKRRRFSLGRKRGGEGESTPSAVYRSRPERLTRWPNTNFGSVELEYERPSKLDDLSPGEALGLWHDLDDLIFDKKAPDRGSAGDDDKSLPPYTESDDGDNPLQPLPDPPSITTPLDLRELPRDHRRRVSKRNAANDSGRQRRRPR